MAIIAPVPQVRRATTRATTTTTITCQQSPSVTARSRTRCLKTELPYSLITADEPGCQSYARVTIADSEGATARGCPRHAVVGLDGITGAHDVQNVQEPYRTFSPSAQPLA